ncbi:hypothetical protein D9M68_165200 [compost metagenome]
MAGQAAGRSQALGPDLRQIPTAARSKVSSGRCRIQEDHSSLYVDHWCGEFRCATWLVSACGRGGRHRPPRAGVVRTFAADRFRVPGATFIQCTGVWCASMARSRPGVRAARRGVSTLVLALQQGPRFALRQSECSNLHANVPSHFRQLLLWGFSLVRRAQQSPARRRCTSSPAHNAPGRVAVHAAP